MAEPSPPSGFECPERGGSAQRVCTAGGLASASSTCQPPASVPWSLRSPPRFGAGSLRSAKPPSAFWTLSGFGAPLGVARRLSGETGAGRNRSVDQESGLALLHHTTLEPAPSPARWCRTLWVLSGGGPDPRWNPCGRLCGRDTRLSGGQTGHVSHASHRRNP